MEILSVHRTPITPINSARSWCARWCFVLDCLLTVQAETASARCFSRHLSGSTSAIGTTGRHYSGPPGADQLGTSCELRPMPSAPGNRKPEEQKETARTA